MARRKFPPRKRDYYWGHTRCCACLKDRLDLRNWDIKNKKAVRVYVPNPIIDQGVVLIPEGRHIICMECNEVHKFEVLPRMSSKPNLTITPTVAL